jgi:hypothetical protein
LLYIPSVQAEREETPRLLCLLEKWASDWLFLTAALDTRKFYDFQHDSNYLLSNYLT